MSKFKKVVIALVILVSLSGFLILNFIRQQYVAPILMYHSIVTVPTPENRLTVSVKTFQRQMRFLKEHHYNLLPLEELAALIREKKPIPPKSVALTFDDGNKDNYTLAFPILKKYNVPAAFFIIINEVGRAQNDRLNWDEIRLMQESALVTFGSHCLGPEPLVNLKSETQLKKEIFDSKKILEENLGLPVNMFSYPEGRFNHKIKQSVKDAGYKLAVATSPGRKFPHDDVFVLKRLRISENAGNPFVFWIETSGFYTFIKERRDSD
jgi:peptidoglycan/xylan/chitin deacetylase (PgdA/CDA1 family)